jgi:hypothetical protein
LSDPNNYRPIVLVSVLSKLFTSILTERLLSWSEDEDKLIDNQFAFRPGRSTVDAIFIMDISSMISLIKNRNNKGCGGSPCLTPSKLSNASESTPPALTHYVMDLVLNL